MPLTTSFLKDFEPLRQCGIFYFFYFIINTDKLLFVLLNEEKYYGKFSKNIYSIVIKEKIFSTVRKKEPSFFGVD